jgi:hypothetical protein
MDARKGVEADEAVVIRAAKCFDLIVLSGSVSVLSTLYLNYSPLYCVSVPNQGHAEILQSRYSLRPH